MESAHIMEYTGMTVALSFSPLGLCFNHGKKFLVSLCKMVGD